LAEKSSTCPIQIEAQISSGIFLTEGYKLGVVYLEEFYENAVKLVQDREKSVEKLCLEIVGSY
jgi:hypothetical protein